MGKQRSSHNEILFVPTLTIMHVINNGFAMLVNRYHDLLIT